MNSILKKITLAAGITALFCNIAAAQDKPEAKGKSEATIGLSYYKKAGSETAVAVVKEKKDGKFVPAKNARVNFYAVHDKEQQLLKSASTDDKGQAVIELQKGLPVDENHASTIVAKIENDKLYENAEEQMHFKEANLTISLNAGDTAHLVTAKVTEIDKDGKEIPVKGAELKFYVQRLFGSMPAGENNTISTDENGIASFAYSKSIPGDTAGLITVAVKMEDNEQFGNIESKAPITWGTALAIIKDPFPRALWGVYAPWPIIITLSILFGIVWSIYVTIVIQLVKIKKESDLPKV